ncbi:hypothetical protein G6F57_013879 [Rhizopus arrhizus]|nr:hypothetical protein G6F24_012426 [Rhizopus arrhizus]KAG1266643.1 hypothetical protein G6F65_014036 [Rhizopus arrhizus]KAG1325004.1 hypothetical protein G6F63_012344 [Rhizopus arrhizus]KAG1369481.1 hypothetical protein G6F61_012294 [Rhizopus arrhizus]KAG1391782.1 hypothetical protein G6F60_012393 [Rhizopus arrhizus]
MLLNNATSTRFSPVTGVLQGSILSPFLYSIYINELPRLLRPQPTTADIFLTELILRLNCLLYADDVVLIAAKADMPSLLKSCEDHNPTQPSSSYTLYGEPISKQSSFPYLGIPFRPGDYLNTVALVNQNKAKALATMNQLSAIGVHPKDFSPLLSARFYSHIGRAQLEYGLAITKITTFLSKQLEDAQNVCLRWIFGGSHTTSTAVISFYVPLLFPKMLCYTISFDISASPEATPNGTNSLGLPFGRDASPTQSSWIVAL